MGRTGQKKRKEKGGIEIKGGGRAEKETGRIE